MIDENLKATRYVYDVKNRPWVTISVAVDGVLAENVSDSESVTSLPLTSASGFPTPPQGGHAIVVVQHDCSVSELGINQYVGLEIMTYTGVSGNTLTELTRAQFGSTRHAFSIGDRVTVSNVANDGVTLGNVVVYGYDSQYLDWMISLTDALGHTTLYTYYANGKLETTRYPDDKGEKYFYDYQGNMTSKQYGTFSGSSFTPTDSLTVNYEYDGNSRLIRTYH